METKFNKMQLVKRRMFAMRNGVIADTMRRAGAGFQIVFGLNLPQIADIAREFGPDDSLAQRLWENNTTRESMLLAPMLVDADTFTTDKAREWISQVPCVEVADVLCLKLLRKMPYALDLVDEYRHSDDRMLRYTALRLMCNLASRNPENAREVGRDESARPDAIKSLAMQLIGTI